MISVDIDSEEDMLAFGQVIMDDFARSKARWDSEQNHKPNLQVASKQHTRLSLDSIASAFNKNNLKSSDENL